MLTKINMMWENEISPKWHRLNQKFKFGLFSEILNAHIMLI